MRQCNASVSAITAGVDDTAYRSVDGLVEIDLRKIAALAYSCGTDGAVGRNEAFTQAVQDVVGFVEGQPCRAVAAARVRRYIR